MIGKVKEIVVNTVGESPILFAVIFSMFIQFFFGSSHTAKVAISILVSSIFVAMYVVAPIIEYIGLERTSDMAISLYAISSLLSIELLAIIITILPKSFRLIVTKFLEVQDVSKK